MIESFCNDMQHLQHTWKHAWQKIDGQVQWQLQEKHTERHVSAVWHIENGHVFEKAAINYSYIRGEKLPEAALPPDKKHVAGSAFEATGLSTILHPQNPFVPVAHCNIRFFCTHSQPTVWWYAAVMDLNPVYGFEEDCIHWHQTCKDICSTTGYTNEYSTFKKACDNYYYLPHRKEHRGIGGLWIERLQSPNAEAAKTLVTHLGTQFLTAYQPIVAKRHPTPYTPTHKTFQNIRRSRYAEFNLIYDRGTRFGLQFGGNTDHVFVSMPPNAAWHYQTPKAFQHQEQQLIETFLTPKDWLATNIANPVT